MLVDKRMLVHEFIYHEYTGRNRSKEPEYNDPITVTHCRIDYSSNYTRTNQSETENAYAIIFCYNGLTTPFLNVKKQSKVVINGNSHIVNRVIPITHPFKNKLFAYEIEVV